MQECSQFHTLKICLNQLIFQNIYNHLSYLDGYIIIIYVFKRKLHLYPTNTVPHITYNLNDKRVGHANDPVLFTAIIKYFNLE
jgi:hypothetical protein